MAGVAAGIGTAEAATNFPAGKFRMKHTARGQCATLKYEESGAPFVALAPCDGKTDLQAWKYDSKTHKIHLASKPAQCMAAHIFVKKCSSKEAAKWETRTFKKDINVCLVGVGDCLTDFYKERGVDALTAIKGGQNTGSNKIEFIPL
ncbi:hypothetical protein DMB37_36080 [Nocardia sp. CS682]|nr:hypothetical protein DMB37_36080 [Nocardia sp. CS682]